MKSTVLTCFLFAMSGAFAAGPPVPFETCRVDFAAKNAPDSFAKDWPVKMDLSRARAVTFDFACEDLQTLGTICVRFRSGKGWCRTTLSPTVEGRVGHVRPSVGKIRETTEGTPAGLDAIDCVL